MPPGPEAKRWPKAWKRPIGGAATSTGTQSGAKTGAARSIARPIEPTSGEESSVEQTL